MITLAIFILFLAFGIALALFWWFLTEILPWLVLIYLICFAVHFLFVSRRPSGGAPPKKSSSLFPESGPKG